jgi:hypothetical protein
MKTYFYKFPKQEDIYSNVQGLIQEQLDGYALVRDGRFIQLRGKQIDILPIEQFRISLSHQGISGALSFLWGLCLAYGSLASSYTHDQLHITLPLV